MLLLQSKGGEIVGQGKKERSCVRQCMQPRSTYIALIAYNKRNQGLGEGERINQVGRGKYK
jgi:hypothetical protein